MYWPQELPGNRDSETLLYADSASENLLAQISSYKKNSGGQCEMFDYPFEHRIVPEYLEKKLLYRGFSALLDQLFKTETQIDCIVGVNDTIALIAQQYLLSANPKRLSTLTLAGFDDSAMAHANNLTSYNWNTTAIIQASFEHLLQTPRSLYLSSKRITEIPGFVVARTSAPDKYECR